MLAVARIADVNVFQFAVTTVAVKSAIRHAARYAAIDILLHNPTSLKLVLSISQKI